MANVKLLAVLKDMILLKSSIGWHCCVLKAKEEVHPWSKIGIGVLGVINYIKIYEKVSFSNVKSP